MMIENDELRKIFKTTSVERIQKIEAGLMHLEKNPNDRKKLDEVMREAHTFKGDSRMLGVQSIETIIHQIEDILGPIKHGEDKISAELCDRIYQAMDAVRLFSREAVTGEEADVNLFMVLTQLMGANTDEEESSLADPDFEPDFSAGNEATEPQENLFGDNLLFTGDSTSGLEQPSQPEEIFAPPPQPKPKRELAPAGQAATEQVNNYQIDTVRVAPEKLDDLMRQAGELSVTKFRIARWLTEMSEIMTLWEEWSHDASINRFALERSEQQLQESSIKQALAYSHRATKRLERLGNLMTHLRSAASEDTASLEGISHQLETGIQSLRLLPLGTIFNLFPRMVRDISKQQGKEVNLVIKGGDTKADKQILEEIKDPLLHILRNAIDHGIETPQEREAAGKPRTATLQLRGYQSGSRIAIEVTDDGRGLDLESIKRTALQRGVCTKEKLAAMTVDEVQSLIFAPGFSTRTEVTELSGRGVGLDVVRENVERLKGMIAVDSLQGRGCEFRLMLNTSVATTRVLIVKVSQSVQAIPVEFVQTMLLLSRQDIFDLKGTQTITFQNKSVSVAWLADLLELSVDVPTSPKGADATNPDLPCVILKVGSNYLGLLVDSLLDEHDVFLKPQSKLLKRVRNVLGTTILGTGEVCPILNPQDMLNSVLGGTRSQTTQKFVEKLNTKTKLLLVEDSIIIRTQMKYLLEGDNYDVTIAVDGQEGFNKLRSGSFDAVVSDVEMPNMTGLELTEKIRQFSEYSELPIVLVTTLASDEDKRRGAEAGANAYLTKGSFDQRLLLDTLKRLI